MTELLSSWLSSATAWTSDVASSRKWQFAATAVTSGAVVAGIIFSYQALEREQSIKELKSSIPLTPQNPIHNKLSPNGTAPQPFSSSDPRTSANTASKEDERAAALAARARAGDFDDALILEQLARNRVFLTDSGLAALRHSFIIIVGCGGVGSHAAAALARSGVSRIRLIDFDQVTLSSLNRHAVATLADVGTPKVACLKRRLEQIVPWCDFDCRNELFGEASAPIQLQPWQGNGDPPRYVVDAIDNIDSKVELLAYCHANGLPVVSSMGAGCKSDPTRLLVGDISSSLEDPLSRSTRRRLRLRGIASGIPVVFSTEKASPEKAQLLPLPEEEFQKGNVGDLGVMPDFRVRILPVLGTMPAMFGLCVANHIMLEIAKYPHDYLSSKGREKMYEAALAHLQGSEERLARSLGEDALSLRLPVSSDDVGYLIEEVYRGRSVISGLATRLVLVRWQWRAEDGQTFIDNSVTAQKSSRLRLSEVVCMTKDEATQHEKQVLKGDKQPQEIYSQDVLALVQRRMTEEQAYEKYR